jgi:DNA modification methylase
MAERGGMMEFQGNGWKLFNADCIEVMAQMPDNSVDCSVFSSPFSSLYIYSDSERDMGNANSHDEFLEHHAFFAREMFRVMKPGSVLCDHLKDTVFYQGSSDTGESGLYPFSDMAIASYRAAGFQMRARVTIWTDPVLERSKSNPERLLYKNIGENSRATAPGMPEYIAVMRKDSTGVKTGEKVRNAVNKWGDAKWADDAREIATDHAARLLKEGMVSGVSSELLLHLAEMAKFPLDQWQQWASPVWMDNHGSDVLNSRFKGSDRDEKHLCPMPLPYIERLLTLYSCPGDIVLDPFSGIGSTGYQATKMMRKFIGSELKPEYAKQAAKFIREAEQFIGDLFGVAAE